MIIKIFGVLDIITAILFWLFGMWGITIFSETIILILALLIIAKGIAFSVNINFASILDIISGIIILLSLYLNMPQILIVLTSLFLLQKGVFSLV